MFRIPRQEGGPATVHGSAGKRRSRGLECPLGVLAVSFACLLAPSCVGVSPVSTDHWWDYFEPGHTEQEIARQFNLYRGKWWNYYARGQWFAEGGHWQAAESDFRAALRKRSKDRRAARSYGMHFWDYFPHRELGVVYYQQGRHEEAVRELEASLETVDSAKAKFYLNKARQALLTSRDLDRRPPEVTVSSHRDGQRVNARAITLSGTAEDDTFVQSIWVNGRKLFTELAQPRLPFSDRVALNAGPNTISVRVADLVGKEATRDLRVVLDMAAPTIYLNATVLAAGDPLRVRVRGAAADDDAVAAVWLNDRPLRVQPGREVVFDEEVETKPGQRLLLRAADAAGNETRGEVDASRATSAVPGKAAQGLADRGTDSPDSPRLPGLGGAPGNLPVCAAPGPLVWASMLPAGTGGTPWAVEMSPRLALPGCLWSLIRILAAPGPAADGTAPRISLGVAGDAITVDQPDFFLDGKVYDASAVARLSVNGEQIACRNSPHVIFSHLVTLTPGKNSVVVEAADANGNVSKKELAVTLRPFERFETSARLTSALLPLRTVGPGGEMGDQIYNFLLSALDEEPRRFNLVVREKGAFAEVLQELKISAKELAAKETAIEVGKLKAAESMLFGRVHAGESGVDVALSLVDTETSQVLVTVDVYGEGRSPEALQWLSRGLVLKMRQRFPVLRGTVVFVTARGFHVDAGAESGAVVGMKLLLFRELEPSPGLVLKEPLGLEARVQQVEAATCRAEVVGKKAEPGVKVADSVIAK